MKLTEGQGAGMGHSPTPKLISHVETSLGQDVFRDIMKAP